MDRIRRWSSSFAQPTTVTVAVALLLAWLIGWALANEDRFVLGLLLLLCVTPIALRWPLVSTFGLYVFLVPFDAVVSIFENQGPTLTRFVGIFAAVVLLSAGLVERRLQKPPVASLWFALFVVWAVLSLAWAVDAAVTLRRLLSLASLFALYMVAVSIKISRRELNAIYALTVAGGIAAAVTAYLSIAEGGRGAITIGQQASNPNSVSAALLIPAALTVGAFMEARAVIQRAGTICALGVIGLGMYSSMSRGALVGLVAMFATFAYRLRVRKAIIVPLIIFVAAAAAMPETFFDRIAAVFTGEDPTGSNRTEIWKVGVTALKEYWLLGAGFANFETVYTHIAPVGPRGAGSGAHNTYLMVWVGLGAVGLTIMLAAVASHFLAIRRVRKREVTVIALEAACFGMLGLAMVGEELLSKTFWLSWILLNWSISNASSSEKSLEAVPPHAQPGAFTAAPSQSKLG